MDKLRNDSTERFVKALLSLETAEECYAFLEDVCTIKELQDMAQRLDVACRLSAGDNYNKVSSATGASSATISRVNRCLQYGENGYKTVLSRISKEKTDEAE